jgi:hypothetical protein
MGGLKCDPSPMRGLKLILGKEGWNVINREFVDIELSTHMKRGRHKGIDQFVTNKNDLMFKGQEGVVYKEFFVFTI